MNDGDMGALDHSTATISAGTVGQRLGDGVALGTLGGAPSRVRLFEADPDLLQRVPSAVKDRLTRGITVPVQELEPGRLEFALPESEILVCFVALEGVLRRETKVLGQRAVELIGPGDVFRPAERVGWATLPYEPSWQVVARSRIGILDREFGRRLDVLPGVAGQLIGRAVQRARILAVQLAIVGLPDLREQLLAMLWHLADRWGTREGGDVVIGVPLKHELLADLVRASRPRVTTRLGELRSHGLLSQSTDGHWRLQGEPPETLEELGAPFREDQSSFEIQRMA